MLPRLQGIFFFKLARAACLLAIVLPTCLAETHDSPSAGEVRGHIVWRENVSADRRRELADKLQKITGWSDLHFDHVGILRRDGEEPAGGSRTAREFLAGVMSGPVLVVLEDASRNPDVAFCRVNPGRWTQETRNNPPAYVVQIDFADFDQVTGDKRALAAFDVGWGLLHELDHVVNDSHDASALGDAGECEEHINQMRRECNLPRRTDYFFTLLPLTTDAGFATRLVRMGFEQDHLPGKKKRYWLIWDAKSVGGLDEQRQIASLR